MNKEQEERLKALQDAKEEYLKTPGIDTIVKEGAAKENFDKLVAASNKCWEEANSQNAESQERKEFMAKFKETNE